jgi:hypothetical protein
VADWQGVTDASEEHAEVVHPGMIVFAGTGCEEFGMEASIFQEGAVLSLLVLERLN